MQIFEKLKKQQILFDETKNKCEQLKNKYETIKKEDNNPKILSIKDILDKVIPFIPDEMYEERAAFNISVYFDNYERIDNPAIVVKLERLYKEIMDVDYDYVIRVRCTYKDTDGIDYCFNKDNKDYCIKNSSMGFYELPDKNICVNENKITHLTNITKKYRDDVINSLAWNISSEYHRLTSKKNEDIAFFNKKIDETIDQENIEDNYEKE